jgi:uncharacterized protein YggE
MTSTIRRRATRWISRVGVAVGLAFAVAACSGRSETAAASPPPDRLTLQATGEVAAAPDMAHVTAGVTAEAPTAAAAMADQRSRMTAVMAALANAGLVAKDVQTTNLELAPVFAPYDPAHGQTGQHITGYRASNRVTVTAHDLALVGPALDALVTAGANDISDISFAVSNEDALLDAARRDAVAKLKAHAKLYADAAGVKLGRILEMAESAGREPRPMMAMARGISPDAATPVSGGELTLQITVSAMFEIVG